MFFSLVLAIAVSVVAVFFALQNTDVVRIVVFGAPLSGQLGVLLLGALAAGTLIGVLIMTPTLVARSIAIARYKRRLLELEQAPLAEAGIE
jgi:uncharacterized integral membrane protein